MIHAINTRKPSVYYSLFKGDVLSVMEVETDVSRGLFHFSIIGLADKATTESSTRILAALKNRGFDTPQRKNHKVVVSLLPANQKKQGIYTDLAIILGYLTCTAQIHNSVSAQICCIGEVKLDGTVQVNSNILQLVHIAYKKGIRHFIIPKNSYTHVINLPDLNIMEIESISEVKNITFYSPSVAQIRELDESHLGDETEVLQEEFDIDKLSGLEYQKRALMIGLTGNHSMLFVGPPGSGKSALAQCAQQLLDKLSLSEVKLRLTSTHQSYNDRNIEGLFTRPCIRPSNSITSSALLGGPKNTGLICMANSGILILDELCEFDKQTIEALRQPLDKYLLTIKSGKSIIKEYIATTIIATTNSCPCGKRMTEAKCICTALQIKRYQSKISEPLADRIPITCQFAYIDHEVHQGKLKLELTGSKMKRLILSARNQQRSRNRQSKYNNYLSLDEIQCIGITSDGTQTLEQLKKTFTFSKRKLINTMRVARTIADIESKQSIESEHLLEAASYIKTKPFD